MDNSSYLQGGLENLKLISDDVWNVYDYDSEFKDVFANISRRESLISHRFYSVSSADILNDLQFTINNELLQQPAPVVDLSENILDEEIFELRDEINGGCDDPYPYLHRDNKIENVYLEDIKIVGCGRHQNVEVNVTYNNAFDPRLIFSGLCESQCFLDDLENDISAQQNVCMDVEDVTDIVDEYYNKYRKYLKGLDCSRTEGATYVKKIQSGQPPKLSNCPPKAFDINTCWVTEEEQMLAEKLASDEVRNIWERQPIFKINTEKLSTSFIEPDIMTPSPQHIESQAGRTPGRPCDIVPKNHQFIDNSVVVADEKMPTSWSDTWSRGNLETVRDHPERVLAWTNTNIDYLESCEIPEPVQAWQSVKDDTVTQQGFGRPVVAVLSENSIPEVQRSDSEKIGAKKSNVKFDLEIVNGNVKLLSRNQDGGDNVHQDQIPQQDDHDFRIQLQDFRNNDTPIYNKDPSCHKMSKALSDTRVYLEEGRTIPVLTSNRHHSKDRAKSMRSESSLTQVESSFHSFQNKPSHQSPRETSHSSFAEGSCQSQSYADVNPVRGRSEIFPKSQVHSDPVNLDPFPKTYFSPSHIMPEVDDFGRIHEEPMRETLPSHHVPQNPTFNKQDEARKGNSNWPSHQNQQFPKPESRGPEEMTSSECKFYNTLKQYGWYDDNYDSKHTEESEKSGISWSYSLGQICEPNTTAQQSMGAPNSQTSKRQLFKSPPPNKRYGNQSSQILDQSSTRMKMDHFDGNLSRSRSVSPVKRQALHNSSFNSQFSSPNKNSPVSSMTITSPEPQKTSSQLNAACEPFIPAHLQNQTSSVQTTPSHDSSSKQIPCQTPNKEFYPNKDAILKLLTSPELLLPFVTSNNAKQALLIQQNLQQIQKQPATEPTPIQHQANKQTTVFTRGVGFHQQPPPTLNVQTPRAPVGLQQRETVVPSPQTNVNLFTPKPQQHPHIPFPAQRLQLPHPPPIIRTNTLIPQWPCPAPAHPPVSRPLNVNIAFPDHHPRPVPLPQRYAPPPVFTWQTFPRFQPQPRFIHPLFNLNNNSSNYEDYGYSSGSGSCDSMPSYSDYSDGDTIDALSVPPARTARPIRANPANLIHINTK